MWSWHDRDAVHLTSDAETAVAVSDIFMTKHWMEIIHKHIS